LSKALETATATGDLPLKAMCRSLSARQHHFEMTAKIGHMVQQNPETAQHANHAGRLAVHEACAHKAPQAVLECLVQAHPAGIVHADNENRLPLHLACMADLGHDSFQCLLNRRASSNNEERPLLPVQAVDGHGKIPLHYACEKDARLSTPFAAARRSGGVGLTLLTFLLHDELGRCRLPDTNQLKNLLHKRHYM
jgi:hypothetical protein